MENSISKKLPVIIFLGAAALTVVCYLPSFAADWHFDDILQIVDNQAVHMTTLSRQALQRAAFESPLANRPLSFISFALDYWRAGGLETAAFHLTNLIIHLAVSILVWIFLRLLFAAPAIKKDVPAPRAAAALSALVFAVHPLQAQSVTYVVQRMNLLASLFTMAALICYLIVRNPDRGPRSRLSAGAGMPVSLGLGLLCKETAFSALILVLVLDFCLEDKGLAAWTRKRLPIIAAAVVIGIVAVAVYARGGSLFLGYHYRDFTLAERLLTQPRVVLWYVGLWAFPAASRLTIDHQVITSTGVLTPPATIAAIIILCGLTLLALAKARRAPLPALGWLWFAGGLALESSFLPLEMAFEHRLYIPGIGLIMIAARVLSRAVIRGKTSLILCVILLFAINTWERNHDWRDTYTLWKDAVEKAPEKPRPRANLCAGLYMNGEWRRAEKACRTALNMDDKNDVAWYNLGLTLHRQGRWQEAEQALEHATRIRSDQARVFYQLGRARALQGKYASAQKALEQAAGLDPDDPLIWYQLGLVMLARGKYQEGKDALWTARQRVGPENNGLQKDIEKALEMTGGD